MEDNKLLDKIEKKIIQILKKEGGAAGLAPLKKATDKMDQPKNFNLKKTLKKMDKVEKHKESDYILTPINEEKYNSLPIRDNVMDYASQILNQINDYENNVGPGEQMIDYNATREAVRALMNAVDRDEEGMMREKDDSAMKKSALGMAMYGKKAKMKESNLREMIRETIFETMNEGLCAKGKAYIAKRKRAGEKSSAYLSGRAVKVCKGQMKG